ncbi:hypothetical protein GQ53DRAFT_754429, partial [Thozetella sp. PMI_491]
MGVSTLDVGRRHSLLSLAHPAEGRDPPSDDSIIDILDRLTRELRKLGCPQVVTLGRIQIVAQGACQMGHHPRWLSTKLAAKYRVYTTHETPISWLLALAVLQARRLASVRVYTSLFLSPFAACLPLWDFSRLFLLQSTASVQPSSVRLAGWGPLAPNLEISNRTGPRTPVQDSVLRWVRASWGGGADGASRVVVG